MARLFISDSRAKSLHSELSSVRFYTFVNECTMEQASVEVPEEKLTASELEKLLKQTGGVKKKWFLSSTVYIYDSPSRFFIGDMEKVSDVSGASELQMVLFSFLDEMRSKKKNRDENIGMIVDKLQDENHPLAPKLLALYNIVQGVKLIRKSKKNVKGLPVKKIDYFAKEFISFDKNLGIVKNSIKECEPNECDDSLVVKNKVEQTPIPLREVTVEDLIGLIVGNIKLPKNLKVL